MAAVRQVASERQIEPEAVLETLRHAMLAAYRKDYPGTELDEIEVKIDPETGEVALVQGDADITPPGFGRIAAQTAKQVILQGVRESEKKAILKDYKARVGSVVSGMLQRREQGNWIVDIGRTTAILPRTEQVYSEEYRHNQRLKVYLKEIIESEHRADIIVSRADPNLVFNLFEIEVPEIQSGAVEIKGIAREPGNRSKVAVASHQEGVDPVGSMVGQRGVRVNAVTNELNDEKMDIILWHEDIATFIKNALSPAEVNRVTADEKKGAAVVEVPDDQLSLAIGKAGQNVRLAAKLTGFDLDIQGETAEVESKKVDREAEPEGELEALELSTRVVNALTKAGITRVAELKELSEDDLTAIDGIGPKSIGEIKGVILG